MFNALPQEIFDKIAEFLTKRQEDVMSLMVATGRKYSRFKFNNGFITTRNDEFLKVLYHVTPYEIQYSNSICDVVNSINELEFETNKISNKTLSLFEHQSVDEDTWPESTISVFYISVANVGERMLTVQRHGGLHLVLRKFTRVDAKVTRSVMRFASWTATGTEWYRECVSWWIFEYMRKNEHFTGDEGTLNVYCHYLKDEFRNVNFRNDVELPKIY